jgi:hypothetical protein
VITSPSTHHGSTVIRSGDYNHQNTGRIINTVGDNLVSHIRNSPTVIRSPENYHSGASRVISSTHHEANRYVDSHNDSRSNIRYANDVIGHSPSTVSKTVRLDGSIVHHLQNGVTNMYNDQLN